MDAIGTPWQSCIGSDGNGFEAELSHWPAGNQDRKARKSERVAVEVSAGLRQRGASGVSVRVLDLSPEGFRASTHLELNNGVDVWLRLPGLEPLHATVAWSAGHFVGCAFERPLHPAVVDMIVRQAGGRA
ncbi:PilZ domain-containing protein [Sphingosinicella sp. YJ22]|uniref:PilZ domain-containing protein n=1 Tax=Sphingosinicella sp. YJ22 TaxID=1104780 RepID=UPI001FAFFCE5|nr:PilZ domain-containing protein [Sphingosinicella sp. YJ22]